MEMRTNDADHTRRVKPRTFTHDFSGVPKHWFGGSAVATALSNGVNLLFPLGEQFFIRSVRHYASRFEHDRERMELIRGFYGQEGRHSREHERFFARMKEHGFEIDAFLRWYERIAYGVFERITPAPVRLSTTAALEHFTAILAAYALADGELDEADPRMQEFLKWHAAEELEHKAVAYDVLQSVDDRYAVRLAGLAMGTAMLGSWWCVATYLLLRQEGISAPQAIAELRALRAKQAAETGKERDIGRDVFWKGIKEYAQPGFHPDNTDDYHLARRYFEERRVREASAHAA